MLAIDQLLAPLPVAEGGAGPAEMDGSDTRLNEISEQVIAGDYLGAAHRVEKLWGEHIYDVRVLGYYLYGVPAHAQAAVAGVGRAGAPICAADAAHPKTHHF